MTSHVTALPPAELRQRIDEKRREHPERVLPFFVTRTALIAQATA